MLPIIKYYLPCYRERKITIVLVSNSDSKVSVAQSLVKILLLVISACNDSTSY